VPASDGYHVPVIGPACAHAGPTAAQPFNRRTACIARSCTGNFTHSSFLPATCSAGFGRNGSDQAKPGAAANGAIAANTSPRIAHRRSVNCPPFECPIAHTCRPSTWDAAFNVANTGSKKRRSRSP